MELKADLHIHTCLSPCADSQMVPSAIIGQAKTRGLDVIGICDHNSAENVSAVRKRGEKQGVLVLSGMEITSAEEVHILALLGDDRALNQVQKMVYANLPGENDEAVFGEQWIVDEDDNIMAANTRLLIGATGLSVNAIADLVHGLGGLVIAAHIDREAFGIFGQLGFVPGELSLDALEVSPRCPPDKMPSYASRGLPLVLSSDAHFLSDVGMVHTVLQVQAPTFSEVALALRGQAGRKSRI